MKDRLQSIASAEGCTIEDRQLDLVLDLAEGDMRRAVQTLQSVHSLLGAESLDETTIAELAGLPPAKVVDDLVDALISSKGVFSKVQEAVEEICVNGYSAQTLMGILLQKFAAMPAETLDEMSKARLAIRIAEAEHCMLDGADEYLQLMTVCGLAMQCFQSTASKSQ